MFARRAAAIMWRHFRSHIALLSHTAHAQIGRGRTCSCLEILNDKPIRMACGEIPTRRDAARAVDYRGAVRRQPICEFVKRIDIEDRVDMADGIEMRLVASED